MPNDILHIQGSEFVEKKKQDSGNITYIYNEKHIKARNKKKVATLQRLGKSIEKLRRQVSEDLDSPEKGEAAMVVALIDETYERVGNPGSAADNHFGVTTWRKKHVSLSGSKAIITYKGKGGVDQKKTVTSKRIVGLLKGLMSTLKANDELFPNLSSTKVNSYLKPFKITAKDIRGFHANEEMKKALNRVKKKGGDEKQRKEEFKKALEETAKNVGHDPGTLKKDYLVPSFEENYLERGKIGVSSSVSDGAMGISRVAGHLGRMMAIRKVAKKKSAKKEKHSGAMLAIMAPAEVMRALRKSGAIDKDTVSADGLHLTLLYLGKAADIDKVSMNAIKRAAEKVCARHAPLAMRISGAGMFTPGDDGTPVYVVPNAKGLSALQADLENVIGSIVDLPSEHGWAPHMTVGYSCEDKPDVPTFADVPEWTAGKVRIQAAGQKVADVRLGRKKAAAEFPLSRRAADDTPTAYVGPIEQQTEKNKFFRKVLFTGKYTQLVVMSVKGGEELGEEVHDSVDQFFRIEEGEAIFVLNGVKQHVKPGEAVVVPAGTKHNVINASKTEPLKVYTLYSPPNHPKGTVHKTKEEADKAEKEQHAMDRLPIQADPVMWSDEQLVEVVKTPHLMDELQEKPELLRAVLEQIEKRKGAQEGLDPKDIGEWQERGWFMLYALDTNRTLGLFRNQSAAEMARARLISMYARGEMPEDLLHDDDDTAFILADEAFDHYRQMGGKGDRGLFHNRGAGAEDVNRMAKELMTHPFHEGKRKQIANAMTKTIKMPYNFEPEGNPEVKGGIPTKEDAEIAGKEWRKHQATKEPHPQYGQRDEWEKWVGEQPHYQEMDDLLAEYNKAHEDVYTGPAKQIAKKQKMRDDGVDPDKMADDMLKPAGFIGRMIRMAEKLDDSGDCESAERLCRQMDLLISRRAHFVPSDKTKAPPMWRKNLDYGEESPYYGNVKEFMKKYPGGLGEYIKKRRKSRKKRERQWKLAQVAGSKLVSSRMRNVIDADMADAIPGRQRRMNEVWKISQQTEDDETLQDANDEDYVKDPLKAPREFVKYWALLLKKNRGKRKKRKGK